MSTKENLIQMYVVIASSAEKWNSFFIPIITNQVHKYIEHVFHASIQRQQPKIGGKVDIDHVLNLFKRNCSQIKDWPISELKSQLQQIQSKIPNFETVLNIVLKMNFKILSSSRVSTSGKVRYHNIEEDEFLFLCYYRCFNDVAIKYPHLFNTMATESQRSENTMKASDLLTMSVKNLMYSLLPIPKITEKAKEGKRMSQNLKEKLPSVQNVESTFVKKMKQQLSQKEKEALGTTFTDLVSKKPSKKTVDIASKSDEQIATESIGNIERFTEDSQSILQELEKEEESHVEEKLATVDSIQEMKPLKPVEPLKLPIIVETKKIEPITSVVKEKSKDQSPFTGFLGPNTSKPASSPKFLQPIKMTKETSMLQKISEDVHHMDKKVATPRPSPKIDLSDIARNQAKTILNDFVSQAPKEQPQIQEKPQEKKNLQDIILPHPKMLNFADMDDNYNYDNQSAINSDGSSIDNYGIDNDM